jgi:sugar (pentulose or hexulose) kinase
MNAQRFDSANIVIDIGSSSIRAIAFSLNGEVIAAARHSYETFYPHPGWAEQDPHDWEKATLKALTELMGQLPGKVHINGLSCTGQCPSYVPVDRALLPLGNVLTYQDNRSVKEAEYVVSLVGNEYVHSRSGHSIEPFFILPKLLWHKFQDPELYSQIDQVLQPCDYLEYFLTGNVFTDPAYACGTLVYDMNTRSWNTELLQKLGISANLFPKKIINSWEQAGTIKDDIAEITGLPKGLKVIRGGPDSQCCSLGVAAIETDVLSNMSGTSTCLNRTLLQPIQDLRVGNYAHVIPERWSAEVGLNTTGVSLKKVAGILFSDLSEPEMYGRVHASVLKSPVGSNGLLYFPYLSNGERDNQDVKGGFYNLSMMTGKEDMMRAVLEGVAFAEKERADLLVGPDEHFTSMRISGGGASSADWCQIKADVMNMPVYALQDVDAAELGASMLISVGTGLVPDFTGAVNACELKYDAFLASGKNALRYAERYEEFRAFEKALSHS